jgi:hypothetical protein
MKNILRPITAGLFSALVAISAQAADLAPGAYSAGSVAGDVTYASTGGSSFLPLSSGTALSQGAIIKTGADSSASIVFSSGSVLVVESNTTIEVSKFQQELFSGPIAVGAEPSVSNTQINVVDGSVIAKVAKLKKGSAFAVNSPVGAAGVRGTTYKVSYNAVTKAFKVTTVEGLVVTRGAGAQSSETPAEAGTEVTYEAGQEVAKADIPVEVLAAIEQAFNSVSPTNTGPTTVVPTINVDNATKDKVDVTVTSPN